jgi:hypothetical protein
MILLNGVMDDEEFVKDVFLMPSFQILPGRMPWDPRAWKIEASLAGPDRIFETPTNRTFHITESVC